MWNRRNLGLGMSVVVIASVAALTGSFGANALLREDHPSGELTLMAPCDAEEHPMEVKKLVSDIKSTFKLAPGGTIFASSAVVTSDADRTTFVLTIKVEKSGKVVSSGQMQVTLDDGESDNLATLCGVAPSTGTYSVSADVRVAGAVKALDSRRCRYTAP